MSKIIAEPGIYLNISADDYFADPAPEPSLTQSIAKTILAQSAEHAQWDHPRLGNGREPEEEYKQAREIGNVAHKILLGRGKDVTIIEADSFRGGDAKKQKDAALAVGSVPILAKHYGRAEAMARKARIVMDGLGLGDVGGDSEVVMVWTDGGIWCRTMVDRLSKDRCVVLDYKTTAGSWAPHDSSFGRKIIDAGWDIQAAMHQRALNELHPESAGRREHIFLAQENYPPYAVVPIELPEVWLSMGDRKLTAAMDVWKRCLNTGIWESYPDHLVVPEYPDFAMSKWLSREENEFVDLRMAG